MTPVQLAGLHASVFETPRPYTQEEFADFLSDASCFFIFHDDLGFALGRSAGDEVELITLAVCEKSRRQGIARVLMRDFEQKAIERGAINIFLEVAESNKPARSLYKKSGFEIAGRRAKYFRSQNGTEDAIVYSKTLKANA